MRIMPKLVIISIPLFLSLVTVSLADNSTYELKAGDILITDFEFHPNSLGGNVACFGAVGSKKEEWKGPYSGYTSEEAYSGRKSYRLVFAKHVLWEPEHEEEYEKSPLGMKRMKDARKLGKSKEIDWAVFMMDMGPPIDPDTVPVTLQPVDISKFRYLIFWVKGTHGGERFKVYFRDTHATTYEPQVKIKPKIKVGIDWQPVSIDLQETKLRLKVDMTRVVQIGLGFGRLDGGRPGNVFYVDRFILVK